MQNLFSFQIPFELFKIYPLLLEIYQPMHYATFVLIGLFYPFPTPFQMSKDSIKAAPEAELISLGLKVKGRYICPEELLHSI